MLYAVIFGAIVALVVTVFALRRSVFTASGQASRREAPVDTQKPQDSAGALALSRAAAEGSSSDALRALFASLTTAGVAAQRQGDLSQAESLYREALETAHRLVERESANARSLLNLAAALKNTGWLATARGEWSQAERAYREGLEALRRIGNTPESLQEQIIFLCHAGSCAARQGAAARGAGLIGESVAIARSLIAQQLGDTARVRHLLAIAFDDLARIEFQREGFAQAEVYNSECLAIRRELLKEAADIPPAQRYEALTGLATALRNTGLLAEKQNDWKRADAMYQERLHLLDGYIQQLGHHTPTLLLSLSDCAMDAGRAAEKLGKPAAADHLRRGSLKIARALLAQHHSAQFQEYLVEVLCTVAQAGPPDAAALRAEAERFCQQLIAASPGNENYPKMLEGCRATGN